MRTSCRIESLHKTPNIGNFGRNSPMQKEFRKENPNALEFYVPVYFLQQRIAPLFRWAELIPPVG